MKVHLVRKTTTVHLKNTLHLHTIHAATAASLGASKKSPSKTPFTNKISPGAFPLIPPST